MVKRTNIDAMRLQLHRKYIRNGLYAGLSPMFAPQGVVQTC